ncbi:hypothetical protein GQ600_19626 [Phytophthora cactorum]|nr:hypothetical protein GQ600_19626 [Phytophthora cactorum]
MDDLDARLENTTAEKTKYTNIRAIARFVEWLYANTEEDRLQSLFTAHFVSLKQSMVNRSRYGTLERRYNVQSAWMRYLLNTA